MSVLHITSNLIKLWDQAGQGYSGKGAWGASSASPPPPAPPGRFWTVANGTSVSILNSGQIASWQVPGQANAANFRTGDPIVGNIYCEMVSTARPDVDMDMGFGIGVLGSTSFFSAGFYGAYTGHVGCGLPKSGICENGSVSNYPPALSPVNTVVGIAYKSATGQMWVSLNNVWLTGDPAAGTLPLLVAPVDTYYFCTSLYSCDIPNGGPYQTTIYPQATAYAPPAGFTRYGDMP